MADLDLFDPNAGPNAPQGGIGSNLSAGVHQAAAGLGMAGAAFGLPTTGWAQGQAQTAQNYREMASRGGIPQAWKEVNGPVDALKYVSGQVAESVPQLGAMAAGSLAGGAVAGPAGAVAGAAATTYPVQFGENLQQQYEVAGKTNPGAAAALAVPQTALQMVAPEGRAARMVLGSVDRGGSRLANAALTAGREGIVNAGIGATSAVLTDVNKAQVGAPMDLLSTTQDALEGAATGGIVGTLIGGGRGLLHAPIPRKPGDAGGDSSRDAESGSPSASGTGGQVSSTLPVSDKELPAYVRAGKQIPGVTDQFGQKSADDVGAAMSGQPPVQGELDLAGAGPFAPRYDAKGNPLPGQWTPNAGAEAGEVGAGPARSEDEAITGLQMLHRDLTQKLGEAIQSGDSNGAAALIEQIKGVEGHLNTLNAAPDLTRSLDFNQRAPRTGSTPEGTVLFGDKTGQVAIDEAQKIATSSAPEPQPSGQPIALPNTPQPAAPVARPGALPTAFEAANARVPEAPAAGRIITPEQAARPGFELRGNPTPQFEVPTKEAPPPAGVDHAGQLEMPFAKPGENPLPEEGARPGGEAEGPKNPTMAEKLLKVKRQLDWDKAQEVIRNRQSGELEASRAEQPDTLGWQTRLRMAWKQGSDNSLQGFHKAMSDVLGAKSPEDAARLIRQKSQDGTSKTPQHKLELMHRALTGTSIEEGLTDEARARGMAQAEGAAVQRGGDETVREGEAPAEAAQPAGGVEEAQPQQGVAGVEAKPAGGAKARAARLQELKTILRNTKDKAEFQRAVNEMYAISQRFSEHSGDRVASDADTFLNEPSNFITDANLDEARRALEASKTTPTEFKDSDAGKIRRSSIEQNPDIGNRTMLPENMRGPGQEHTAHDMATWLTQNAKSPVVRTAMRLVLNSGRDMHDVPIRMVRDGDMVPQHVQDEMSTGADAFTRIASKGATPEIWAHAKGADEETMAHEILHAALPEAMSRANDGGMTSVMNDVRRAMQEAGMFDGEGGKFVKERMFENPNEFTSYGFSSPTFRRMLDQLDQPGKPTMWERFKSAVAAIFKSPKAFMDKLLDRQPSGVPSSTHAARMEEALRNMLSPDSPRAQAEHETIYRQMSTSPAGATDALGRAAHDVWDGLRGMVRDGLNRVRIEAIPTHALSDAFSYRLPALKDAVRALDERTNQQHMMARKAAAVHDSVLKAYKAAGKSLDRFNEVIEDTQIAMIDPREKGALDRTQSNLLRAKDVLDQVNRKTEATDLEKATARGGLRRAVAAARLADNWRKMTEPERKATGDLFDALKESIDTREATIRDILLKSRDGFHNPSLDKMREEGASQEDIDNEILRTYGGTLRRAADPYAPLRRYGDWVTTASSPEYRAAEAGARDARVQRAQEIAQRGESSPETDEEVRYHETLLHNLTQDPEHRIVQFHDNSARAETRMKELQAQHPGMQVQRFSRNDYMQRMDSMTGGMVDKIISAVNEKLPPELRDNIAATIREMYVDSLPDNSFEHSMQGREGVSGYSTDFSRAALDTLLRDSFNISSLRTADEMGAAMRDMDDQRKASNDDTLNHIYKSMAARVKFNTDHQNFRQWEQRISEVTHVMYLGASPGFMLMNAMQMPMITAPMLYSRFGLHANGALTHAVADVWKAIDKGNLNLEERGAHLTQQERDVLTTLENQGILNMTQLHEMAVAARQSNIIDPHSVTEGAAKTWDLTKYVANLPAQYIETVNRAASALAAYRLAREGRSRFGAMEHGAAQDYAAKIVRDSHVDYSAANNSAWLRAPGGRMLFQFKKYWLNMLSMVGLNMWDAFGHAKEIKGLRNELSNEGLADDVRAQKQAMLDHLMERRSVARGTLGGLYGMHFLLTGAQGMPFAAAGIGLSNVLRNWYNDPEDHADTATDFQNYLANALGVDGSDTLMHGVMGGIFGMGVTQRIGMGDLANPVRITANRAGQGMADTYDKILLGLLGPTAGLTMSMAQGMDQMARGQYAQGVSKLLPKAAGDVLKGATDYENGGLTNPKGQVTQPLSNLDAIKQAIGVTPEAVTNFYDARQATADAKNAFTTERKALIADAAKGGMDAQQAVQEFNERNPDPNLRITQGEVLKARNAAGKAPKPPSAREAAINARSDRSGFTKG